ncbi:MAG: ATPase [Pseudomonadota bacterium]
MTGDRAASGAMTGDRAAHGAMTGEPLRLASVEGQPAGPHLDTPVAPAVVRPAAGGVVQGNLALDPARAQTPAQGAPDDALHEPQIARMPPGPVRLADLGLGTDFLIELVLKAMHRLSVNRVSSLSRVLTLPPRLVAQLLESARDQRLISPLPQEPGERGADLRWGLSDGGRAAAIAAFETSGYVGPVPVPIAQFAQQAATQTVRSEVLGKAALAEALRHMTLSDTLLQRLGPAANAGAAVLLYGPPGNGKTAITEALGRAFRHHVWIPHALEIEGAVITLYDPGVHRLLATRDVEALTGRAGGLRAGAVADARYVPCRRPHLVAGGELTVAMLDLAYAPASRMYEAPLQLKAIGGTLVIDDFGRQHAHPQEILNRMTVPLESGLDYLALQTGRKFATPFDSLVLFATNMAPVRLADEAALRRLRFKVKVEGPSRPAFLQIFAQCARRSGLPLDAEVLHYILSELYEREGKALQAFHPGFFCDQAHAICAYEGIAPQLTPQIARQVWENLFPES